MLWSFDFAIPERYFRPARVASRNSGTATPPKRQRTGAVQDAPRFWPSPGRAPASWTSAFVRLRRDKAAALRRFSQRQSDEFHLPGIGGGSRECPKTGRLGGGGDQNGHYLPKTLGGRGFPVCWTGKKKLREMPACRRDSQKCRSERQKAGGSRCPADGTGRKAGGSRKTRAGKAAPGRREPQKVGGNSKLTRANGIFVAATDVVLNRRQRRNSG